MSNYILIGILSGLLGLCVGYSIGENEILYRDHVQAKAGIFIDGYDKNKVYILKSKD